MKTDKKIDVNREELKIKREGESLACRLRKPFQKFIDDIECGTNVEVKTEKHLWDNNLRGYDITEIIELYELHNYLVVLNIKRHHYIDLESQEYCGGDEGYEITLYYHDHDDCLTYSDDYYPDMDNDIVYDKVKELFKTGINMCKLDIKYREKK